MGLVGAMASDFRFFRETCDGRTDVALMSYGLYPVLVYRVGRQAGRPTIGDDVIVGAGAKILGPVEVGSRARVGANAVVVDNVPPGSTVVGIPARPVPRKPESMA